MLQRDFWPCPFCDEGVIEVLVRPMTYSAKRSRSAAAGSKITWTRIKEEVVILTEKCPKCSKPREDIKKKWRKEGII